MQAWNWLPAPLRPACSRTSRNDGRHCDGSRPVDARRRLLRAHPGGAREQKTASIRSRGDAASGLMLHESSLCRHGCLGAFLLVLHRFTMSQNPIIYHGSSRNLTIPISAKRNARCLKLKVQLHGRSNRTRLRRVHQRDAHCALRSSVLERWAVRLRASCASQSPMC